MWMKLVWVGLGAMLGASSRFLITEGVKSWLGNDFPWGTLTVNMLGSLCMGFLFGLAERHILTNEHAKLFLMVGFLGSLTTFSSFALDNVALLKASTGFSASMLLNVGIKNILGILLVLFGIWISKFV